MLKFIETFLGIAILRVGPEDLPDSAFLLRLVLLLYVLAQLPLLLIVYERNLEISISLFSDLLLMVACPWIVLSLAKKPRRFRQTLTALLGTGVLVTIASLPLAWWAMEVSRNAAPTDAPPAAITVIWLVLVGWYLAAYGHVYSRALSSPFSVGLLVSIVYLLISLQVAGWTEALAYRIDPPTGMSPGAA